MRKPKLRRAVDHSPRRLVRYIERYQDRLKGMDIESLDDVVGEWQMAVVPKEPTHENQEPVNVRPWYLTGFDEVKCGCGKVRFQKPYAVSEIEAEIVRRARQRIIDDIEKGYSEIQEKLDNEIMAHNLKRAQRRC